MKSYSQIDKETFKKYEKDIIDKYYDNKKNKTQLIPKNNNPSYLKQDKYIIVVNFNNIKKKVSDKNTNISELPEKTKIKMYHIGEEEMQNVSYGYDKEDNIFKYPALDFGGLTNFKQKVGDKHRFFRNYKLDKNTPLVKLCDDLYNDWKQLMKKNRFYGNIKNKLYLWLINLQDLLKETNDFVFLHFFHLPSKHRIIVTYDDIKNDFGNYYTRVYGGDSYAKSSTNKKYFTSVEQNFITGNINRLNILNEYSTY